MSKLEITRGKWEISPDNNWECAILTGDDAHHIEVFNSDIDGWEQMHGNATLICDAGNTFQSCGLLPSELLKQNKELREALSKALAVIIAFEADMNAPIIRDIEQALKNSER